MITYRREEPLPAPEMTLLMSIAKLIRCLKHDKISKEISDLKHLIHNEALRSNPSLACTKAVLALLWGVELERDSFEYLAFKQTLVDVYVRGV